jgi:hypothetical protein
MLESRFRLSHGMLIDLVQRDAAVNDPTRGNFASLRDILEGCHETPARRAQLVSEAAALVRSLHRAGILRLAKDTSSDFRWVVVDQSLQWNFSMFQTLSLFLVEAVAVLDPTAESYPLEVLAIVEAVLEDPRTLLLAQQDRERQAVLAALKAEGVEFEERVEKVRQVTWPKPESELIDRLFEVFRSQHGWVAGARVSPKGIARELWTEYLSFTDFIRRYGMARSEGLLLRYLSQAYKTLAQGVPELALTEGLHDLLGFLRTTVEHVDSSLLEEWESLVHPEVRLGPPEAREAARAKLRRWELLHDERALRARLRAELHHLVRAIAQGDWELAAAAVRSTHTRWTLEQFEAALAPFVARFGGLPQFDAQARYAHHTRIEATTPGCWLAVQTLCDPEGENSWRIEAEVDLRGSEAFDGPLLEIVRIGDD